MIKSTPAPTTKRLILLIGVLLVIGIAVIASSTSVYSQSLYNNPYKFAFLQIGWIVLGTVGFYFFYKHDYQELQKLSYIIFVLSLVFLGILAFSGILPCEMSMSFAPCINGANRWFYLNPPPLPEIPFLGVLGFQPGEFAKLSLIMYLSVQISKNVKRKESPFLVFSIISGMLSALILLQPNMSTAVLVFLLGTIIYFASDAELYTLLKMIPVVFILGITLIVSSPYRRERLAALLRIQDSESSYHMEQVLISLGSGGLTGVGFGQSMQKYHYLPEIASDSIFALIGEEFGFIGTSLLVILFSYLIYIGFSIAKNAPDMLGRLLAVGITSWIGLQFLVNSAAMTGLIPLTGVPMPLISYGGSSMVFSLMGLGILANISRQGHNS
jgi:cell division protein FtsW